MPTSTVLTFYLIFFNKRTDFFQKKRRRIDSFFEKRIFNFETPQIVSFLFYFIFMSSQVIESSLFVWDALKSQDDSFSAIDILDTIVLKESLTINSTAHEKNKNIIVDSWLFTSSDGKVKSKLKSRWNSEGIIEYCESKQSIEKTAQQTFSCHIFNNASNIYCISSM
jgi:hypothetical protein